MSEEELLLVPKEIPKDLEARLEALIFVSKEPVSIERMGELLRSCGIDCDSKTIRSALQILMEKWHCPNRSCGQGFTLTKMAGGYVFIASREQSTFLQAIAKEKPCELTKTQIEVLAIVAYRQPITRVDVDDIRGVDSSTALKRLMQLKLIKILGKSEGLGRPLLYGTTKFFLEFFSLNSLNDLPTLKQFEALGPNDTENLKLDSDDVSVKDLFRKDAPMFSSEVEELSEEALKGLDEALLRMDDVKKISLE
jgi:segregation and condensation protein B